jgi:hypothetical protein
MQKSALREEPREQRAAVIRSNHEASLLDWLETNGRLIARDVQEPEYPEAEEEISGLIDVDDPTYDDIDDDDEVLDLEE